MGMNDGFNAKANAYPTETSPLISRTTIRSVSRDNGSTTDQAFVPTSNGTFDSITKTPAADEREVESQSIDSRQEATQYEGLPEVKKNLKYIFPAVAIGIFLSAADGTLIVSSYGRIGSEMNALHQASWISTAYFLTLTSFQPLYGKLSDIFGRKSCLLTGYVIFGIGCLGCGLAQDIYQLIAARAFAGIGASAMSTVVSILFSDICSTRERGQWQSYINIIYAFGSSTGAPLGGIAADYIGWRWAFIVQAPLCAVAFAAVALALHLPREKESASLGSRLRRIDFTGAIVLISAVFTILLGLDHGSNVSWTSPLTLGSFGFSLFCWLLLLVVESKVAAEPFAPGRVICNRTLMACYACNFFSMAGWLSTIFYAPLYFQTTSHVTATGAGVRLIPSVITGVLGSLFAGSYMRRSGKYLWLTVMAYSGLTVGTVVVFLMSGPVVESSVGILLGMMICGFGNGNGITTTLIALIANVPHEDQAIATACMYLFRSLGSTFGIAVSATVSSHVLRSELASSLPALGMPQEQAAEVAERVRESLAYLRNLDPVIRNVVEHCFAKSTNAAFGFQVLLVFGAALSAWFIRERALLR